MRRPTDFVATVRRGPLARRATRGSVVVHLSSAAGPVPSDAAQQRAPGPLEAGAARPGTLVGVVVSRSVGGAVVRNLVKRRLRHALREQLPVLPEGSRLVVRAQPGAARLPYSVLRDDLAAALERVLPRPGRAGPVRR